MFHDSGGIACRVPVEARYEATTESCLFAFIHLVSFVFSFVRAYLLRSVPVPEPTHCSTVTQWAMRAANVKVSFPSVSYHKQGILQWIKLNKWFPLFRLTRRVFVAACFFSSLATNFYLLPFLPIKIFAFQMDAPHFRHKHTRIRPRCTTIEN